MSAAAKPTPAFGRGSPTYCHSCALELDRQLSKNRGHIYRVLEQDPDLFKSAFPHYTQNRNAVLQEGDLLTDLHARDIFPLFKNTIMFDLSKFPNLTGESIAFLPENITWLALPQNTSYAQLKYLARLTQLQSLFMKHPPLTGSVNDLDLSQIPRLTFLVATVPGWNTVRLAKVLPSTLTTLDLNKGELDDKYLAEYLAGTKTLTSLHLTRIQSITANAFRGLSPHHPLTTLSITSCPQVDGTAFYAATSHIPRLDLITEEEVPAVNIWERTISHPNDPAIQETAKALDQLFAKYRDNLYAAFEADSKLVRSGLPRYRHKAPLHGDAHLTDAQAKVMFPLLQGPQGETFRLDKFPKLSGVSLAFLPRQHLSRLTVPTKTSHVDLLHTVRLRALTHLTIPAPLEGSAKDLDLSKTRIKHLTMPVPGFKGVPLAGVLPPSLTHVEFHDGELEDKFFAEFLGCAKALENVRLSKITSLSAQAFASLPTGCVIKVLEVTQCPNIDPHELIGLTSETVKSINVTTDKEKLYCYDGRVENVRIDIDDSQKRDTKAIPKETKSS